MRIADLAFVAAFVSLSAAADTADVLYIGGDILTMRGPTAEYAESLAVKDGKILFVGPRVDGEKLAGPATKVVDLAGTTLLPGFIDTHGHFVYFGKNLVDANLFDCSSVDDLVARMQQQAEQTPAGGWIVGFGYQARGLKEGRPPTSAELDRISADRPVMVVDSSGHLEAANAAAFKAAVNRLSGSGKVVGPDERVGPYDALRAVTATAAYQLKEEKSKGTLEAGKLADLVILDRNPLTVERTMIKDITVLETIKEGRTVYRRAR